jgi:alpha-galactosidase|eukprot:COSAG02_NODE_6520_length_3522_cov_4.230724_5_plen_241_part_00
MATKVLLQLLLLCSVADALDDGLCQTPIMGMNSWTAYGASVTEADLLDVGKFFVSSGLREAGYKWVNSDDGWDTHARGADGRLQPDLQKFPDGIRGLTKKLGAMNLSFGIYTAESSVVCSGRPGTLFQEYLDAATFDEWGVGLVKNDNCGEYSYGNARFHVFADAVASLGSKMIISTEPFSLVPGPTQARFAHYWRTGNDIGANWNTILNRIDINDKWAAFAGPGHFNDPDVCHHRSSYL